MATLAQFIEDLATDPALHQPCVRDPQQAMRSYGLSDSEIDAVSRGNKETSS